MNLLNKVEKYIRRQALAELIETNDTYLSALSSRREMTEGMKERLVEAVEKIVKELTEMLEEEK